MQSNNLVRKTTTEKSKATKQKPTSKKGLLKTLSMKNGDDVREQGISLKDVLFLFSSLVLSLPGSWKAVSAN